MLNWQRRTSVRFLPSWIRKPKTIFWFGWRWIILLRCIEKIKRFVIGAKNCQALEGHCGGGIFVLDDAKKQNREIRTKVLIVTKISLWTLRMSLCNDVLRRLESDALDGVGCYHSQKWLREGKFSGFGRAKQVLFWYFANIIFPTKIGYDDTEEDQTPE